MKKISLLVLLVGMSVFALSQPVHDIDFEDSTQYHKIFIDTVSNPNNIWKIGSPNKAILSNSFSSPNVIITDTNNYYPTNDTSSFIIIHNAAQGWVQNYNKVDVGGYYYVNSDSLTDYAFIDFSVDKGITWYNIDSSIGFCSWGATLEMPVFTGNSNGWKHFYYCIDPSSFNLDYSDTVLYRFTFISDSIQTNKEGIMFDNLHFEDWSEGISEIEKENLISIYPNPVSNKLFIETNKIIDNASLQIINCQGQILFENNKFESTYIDVSQYCEGVYLLKYMDGEYFSIKRFVVLK